MFHIIEGIINKNSVLLGNTSTVNIFCEASLLRDIHTVNTVMTIHCQSGIKDKHDGMHQTGS